MATIDADDISTETLRAAATALLTLTRLNANQGAMIGELQDDLDAVRKAATERVARAEGEGE